MSAGGSGFDALLDRGEEEHGCADLQCTVPQTESRAKAVVDEVHRSLVQQLTAVLTDVTLGGFKIINQVNRATDQTLKYYLTSQLFKLRATQD